MKRLYALVFALGVLTSVSAIDFDKPLWGLRGAVGTDISLVPAFGGELSLAFDSGDTPWLEFDLGYFYSFYRWEGSTYVEETTSNIILLRANRLFNYKPGNTGTFYFFGTGVGVVSVYWKETSKINPAYLDEVSATGGGFIVSVGLGRTFNGKFEVKLDLPMLIIFGGYYGTRVSPMLGIGAGVRF